MKILPISSVVMLLVLWAALPAPTHAQSPKDVLQHFWLMEISGGRLSPEGWGQAAHFFVHPPKRQELIVIVSDKYKIDEVSSTASTAEIYVGCNEFGQLNSRLRFIPAPSSQTPTQMICRYKLTLVDGRWRISDGPPGVRITVDTAITYVSRARDKTSDPQAKLNAAQTLSALRKLK